MKKIIRLTESDLTRIVKRVISEVKTPNAVSIYTTNDTFSPNGECSDYFKSNYGNEPFITFDFSNLRKSSNCELLFDTKLTGIHNCQTQYQSQTQQILVKDGGKFDCNTKQLTITSTAKKEMVYNLHKNVTQGQEVLINLCNSNFKDKTTNSKFGKCSSTR